ncbi:hypothetical protein LDI01_28650 [Lentilactobacillus diolivorans]|nr:hypothetical protein LDI01_28650 [Lentilactobacillus diolivorans]
MREIDQPTALLADLLTDRYIRHLTIPQTVADLSTKYHQGYLAGLLTDIKTGPY